MSSEVVPFAVGDVLEDKWQVVSVLGQGGMGKVLLGRDLALERTVAIKVLNDALSGDADFRARFEKEAKLTAKLEHPNIVPVYAVGRHRDRPFIVMKHLQGAPLSDWLTRQSFPLPDLTVLGIMRQLADALDHVHTLGFVHRDIKPSNLFFADDGTVSILDFGICRDPAAVTQSSAHLGSANYLAPELLENRQFDGRADLYALGVVLFQLCTGALPYSGASDATVGYQHVHASIPKASAKAAWVSPAVNEVLHRALEKTPEARFQTAGELVTAIERAFSGIAPPPGPRRRTRLGQRMAVALAVLLGASVLLGAGVLGHLLAAPPAPTPRQPAPAGPPVTEAAPTATPSEPAPPRLAPNATTVAPAPHRALAHRAAAVPSWALRVVTAHDGHPTWATLAVDGKVVGGTPATVQLKRGVHRVEVTRPGFRTVHQTVRVGDAAPEALRIELEPS